MDESQAYAKKMTPDLSAEPDRLVIYPSRVKTSLALLGSIAFVVVCIWIAASGFASRGATWKVIIASYLGIPFFSGCGLYAAYRLARRRPMVEIDSTGIKDAASALGVGHLSWDEIDYVVPYRYSGQSMLGIVPRDLDVVLSRQNVFVRSLIKLGLAMGSAPINIPQVTLPIRVQELAELLHTRYGVRVAADV